MGDGTGRCHSSPRSGREGYRGRRRTSWSGCWRSRTVTPTAVSFTSFTTTRRTDFLSGSFHQGLLPPTTLSVLVSLYTHLSYFILLSPAFPAPLQGRELRTLRVHLPVGSSPSSEWTVTDVPSRFPVRTSDHSNSYPLLQRRSTEDKTDTSFSGLTDNCLLPPLPTGGLKVVNRTEEVRERISKTFINNYWIIRSVIKPE